MEGLVNVSSAPVDQLCAALLDGDLNERERWSAKRRMLDDPELRGVVRQQEQIRASIRQRFEPPDLSRVVDAVARQARLVEPTATCRRLPGASAESRTPVRWLVQCVAAALVLCLVTWLPSGLPSEDPLAGAAGLGLQVESTLSEAVALGMVGAAAAAGSRRLTRGRRGRFLLARSGSCLLLPAGVVEAVTMPRPGLGEVLVYRSPSGLGAVAVMEPAGAGSLGASDRLRRRGMDALTLIGMRGHGSATSLQGFDLVPSGR